MEQEIKTKKTKTEKLINFLTGSATIILFFSTYIIQIKSLINSGINWNDIATTANFILIIIFSIIIVWKLIFLIVNLFLTYISYKAGKNLIKGNKD